MSQIEKQIEALGCFIRVSDKAGINCGFNNTLVGCCFLEWFIGVKFLHPACGHHPQGNPRSSAIWKLSELVSLGLYRDLGWIGRIAHKLDGDSQ